MLWNSVGHGLIQNFEFRRRGQRLEDALDEDEQEKERTNSFKRARRSDKHRGEWVRADIWQSENKGKPLPKVTRKKTKKGNEYDFVKVFSANPEERIAFSESEASGAEYTKEHADSELAVSKDEAPRMISHRHHH